MERVDAGSCTAVEEDEPSQFFEFPESALTFGTVAVALESGRFLLERLIFFVHDNSMEPYESRLGDAGLVHERLCARERLLAFLLDAVVSGALPFEEVLALGEFSGHILRLNGEFHCLARVVVYRSLVGCSFKPCFLKCFRIGEASNRYKCGNNRYAYSFHFLFGFVELKL